MAYILLSLEELHALRGAAGPAPTTFWFPDRAAPPLLPTPGERQSLEVPYNLNNASFVHNISPGPVEQTPPPSLSRILVALSRFLLLVSGLVGILAIVSALGFWPVIAAEELGLDQVETFCLLVGGGYTLTSTLYVIWQTRFLQDRDNLAIRVHLMMYINLFIGGAVSLAVIIALFAVAAILLLLAGLGALLIHGSRGQPTPQSV